MNKLKSLDETIKQSIEEYDSQIIEVTSLKDLYELSSAGGGSIQGAPASNKRQLKKELSEGRVDMISRKNVLTEAKLRQYIRNKIKENISNKKEREFVEEQALRQVIRNILKEGDISDIHPHRSTGINMLEDVLKKAIPTLRMDYKRLTTDEKQRNSFRSHIIKAVQDSLRPMAANDQYLQGAESGQSSSLMAEPTLSEEELELEEADIQVDITGDDKKIPVEDDDKPSDEEQFGTGLEDMDETGRNMAFTSYKKVSQYILDAYDSLANPKDKEVFTEYLITNLKLYFDKFEDELKNTVEEPTSPSYQQQA